MNDREITNVADALVKLHHDVRDRLRSKVNKRRRSPETPRGGRRHRLVAIVGGRTHGKTETTKC
jgi:hypothetical protein